VKKLTKLTFLQILVPYIRLSTSCCTATYPSEVLHIPRHRWYSGTAIHRYAPHILPFQSCDEVRATRQRAVNNSSIPTYLQL